MKNEQLTERVARVEAHVEGVRELLDTRLTGIEKTIAEHKGAVDKAFTRGANVMDDLRAKVQANEIAKWKQWIVIIIVATGAGTLPPWLVKLLS